MAGNSELAATVERFVLQWGDMGNFWGVNRSIAQIHALLYLTEAPINAEQIAEQLGIARSNVSNSLRELLAWQLIYRVPIRGDRRDHYQAETDLWLIAKRIAEGRKARELDPAQRALETAAQAVEADPDVSPEIQRRLTAMAEFVGDVDSWYQDMLTLPHTTLKTLVRLGAGVAKLTGKRGTAE